MKIASIEKIAPDFGSSFTLRKFDEAHSNSKPKWHSHPEIELVYVKEGSGKRHIGNHIEQYIDGDLILVGPHLPHYGFTDRFSKNKFEIVLHFTYNFLGANFFNAPELSAIDRLLNNSRHGLSFFGNIKEEVGERLESMFYMNVFERLTELLNILQKMATSREMNILNAKEVLVPVKNDQTQRLDFVYNYVREHFEEDITLEEIANQVHMAVPSFCRFFKTHTNKTFIEFVQQYRITHACKLLVETGLPITEISFECGFNNFSHFNKVFKKITKKSPSQYRKEALLNIAR